MAVASATPRPSRVPALWRQLRNPYLVTAFFSSSLARPKIIHNRLRVAAESDRCVCERSGDCTPSCSLPAHARSPSPPTRRPRSPPSRGLARAFATFAGYLRAPPPPPRVPRVTRPTRRSERSRAVSTRSASPPGSRGTHRRRRIFARGPASPHERPHPKIPLRVLRRNLFGVSHPPRTRPPHPPRTASTARRTNARWVRARAATRSSRKASAPARTSASSASAPTPTARRRRHPCCYSPTPNDTRSP